MLSSSMEMSERRPPLESFLRDFVEHWGGVWDEIEPQVYDLLLPPDDVPTDGSGGKNLQDQEMARVTFDPDALPEYPDAQLAGPGTPLIDRLLEVAVRRGRYARAYLSGLNLSTHHVLDAVTRALTVPPGMELEVHRGRLLYFPIAVFWFEATFVSDQKEHQTLPIAFDLHYARQVRHLHRLLTEQALHDEPDVLLPDAKHASPCDILSLARREIVRTLSSLANTRRQQSRQRLDRQVTRMKRYYEDMQAEVLEQQRKARRGSDPEKYARRIDSLQREQQLRISELQRKNALTVQLRLSNLLVVRQAKLRLDARLLIERQSPHPLEMVWDPLLQTLEAVPCPGCHEPTLVFTADRLNRPACPQCTGQKGKS